MFIPVIFEVMLVGGMFLLWSYENSARQKSVNMDFDAKLVLVNENDRKIRLNSEQSIIGTDKICDVILHDGEIAPRHAEISRVYENFWFSTFDHHNYTLKRNGRVIYEGCEKRKLFNGDTILLSDYKLKFEVGGNYA